MSTSRCFTCPIPGSGTCRSLNVDVPATATTPSCTSALRSSGTLIAAVQGSESHARLVRGLVALAGQLGLVTTAEGIETAEQAALVRKLGFQRGQGFFFGTPRPPAEATLG